MFENESISIGKAAKILFCSVVTLRRWEKLGKLSSIFRTFGNHRRYNIHDINKIINKNKKKPFVSHESQVMTKKKTYSYKMKN